ncbi:MAG: arginine--tRNA ligase, partial [Acidimicrobiales bacterium]
MNLYAEFQDLIGSILRRIAAQGRMPENLDLQRFTVEPPRDPAHGDLSTNAAMVYAKEARSFFTNSRQLAVEIAAALSDNPDVAEAEVAGPGFINVRFKPAVFARVLRAALEQGPRFGRPALGGAKKLKLNVEYVSANPTGPMHVGHG